VEPLCFLGRKQIRAPLQIVTVMPRGLHGWTSVMMRVEPHLACERLPASLLGWRVYSLFFAMPFAMALATDDMRPLDLLQEASRSRLQIIEQFMGGCIAVYHLEA